MVVSARSQIKRQRGLNRSKQAGKALIFGPFFHFINSRVPIYMAFLYNIFVNMSMNINVPLGNSPSGVRAGRVSGNDPHVTTWLFEFTRVHGPSSRAVTIDVVAPYATAGPMLLPLTGGFPPNASDLDRVIEYLDGV